MIIQHQHISVIARKKTVITPSFDEWEDTIDDEWEDTIDDEWEDS